MFLTRLFMQFNLCVRFVFQHSHLKGLLKYHYYLTKLIRLLFLNSAMRLFISIFWYGVLSIAVMKYDSDTSWFKNHFRKLSCLFGHCNHHWMIEIFILEECWSNFSTIVHNDSLCLCTWCTLWHYDGSTVP